MTLFWRPSILLVEIEQSKVEYFNGDWKALIYKSLLIAGAIVIMIDGRQNCNCELAFKIQGLRVIKNRIKIAEFNI